MRSGEIFQDTALLLLPRRHHRHYALDTARALRTLCATTDFAPLPPRTDRPLGRVIGRGDAFDLHAPPQRLASLQNLVPHPFGEGHTTGAPRFQEPLALPTKPPHIRPKRRAFPGARAPPGPRETAGSQTPSPGSAPRPITRPTGPLAARSSHRRAPPLVLSRGRGLPPLAQPSPASWSAPPDCSCPHASARRRYRPSPAGASAWTSDRTRYTTPPWPARGPRRCPWAPPPARAPGWSRRTRGTPVGATATP
jgi:hypothetical protein